MATSMSSVPVDQNRAHRGGPDKDAPTSSRVHVSGPECFSGAIRAAVIPPNFRLATGVSKFTGESKPETWLEDYRVAVQIGGSNDEVAMKHLPLMLEGSARAWLNQLAPRHLHLGRSFPSVRQNVRGNLQATGRIDRAASLHTEVE